MNGLQIVRCFGTGAASLGKKNFKKFHLGKFRGMRIFKEERRAGKHSDIPIYDYGERQVGYMFGSRLIPVPEMIPELVVPNLEGCELKPYVSYRASDVVTEEFTAEDLFNAVYSEKIVKDFKEGKLSETGDPIEASEQERLSAVQAELLARKTGSDIFRVQPKIELELPYPVSK